MNFATTALSAALLLAIWPAQAAEPAPQAGSFLEAIRDGKPLTNFRLRYEYVDQDGKDEEANAWTLRSLVGWKTKPFHDLSIVAQLIGVTPFSHQYNDMDKGVPDPERLDYPVVADPEDYDLNQLFVEYTGLPGTRIRLGREAVYLDNWRFIGDVRFRQVMQVMNGVSLVNTSLPNTEITLAHYGRVKQISSKWQDANVEIANLKYKITPLTSLTGYGYFIDWDGSALQASSTRTLGLRLDGASKLAEPWKVLYTAEYAKQDDYKDGSDAIDNHYYRVGAGIGHGDWFLRVDQEKLSGNSDGRAFQTPLGTNHLFQGWADVFLVTPAQGIEDTMLIAGGKLLGATLKAEYHWIAADRDFAKVGGGTGDRYGEEFDLGVYYGINKQLSASLEYANFREDDQYAGARKRDIEKLWLTVMYSF